MRIPLPSPVTTASAARDVERPASVDRAALPPTSALLALSGDQITLFLSPFVSRLSLVVPFISLPNPLPSFLCPPPSGSEQQPVPGGPGSGSQVQPALQSAGGWRNRAPPGPVPIPSFKDTQQREIPLWQTWLSFSASCFCAEHLPLTPISHPSPKWISSRYGS